MNASVRVDLIRDKNNDARYMCCNTNTHDKKKQNKELEKTACMQIVNSNVTK